MKRMLMAGLIALVAILSACSNNEPVIETKEDIQATVQAFYDEFSAIEQESTNSLEDFNALLASYSAGEATAKELTKGIDAFQATASKLSKRVEQVEIASGLPQDVKTLLEDSQIAFISAYSLKKQAAESADSDAVTAEQFKDMNSNADLAMLYGISKLNEARVASGLLTEDAAIDTE